MASCFSTTRNNIIPLLVLLPLLFAGTEVAAEPPSVVPSACNEAAAVIGASFTVDFCLSALGGHSAGAADNGDLALVAVDLATANATTTEARIDALLGGVGGALSKGLLSCRALYDAVVRLYQPDCHAAVRERRYGDAKSCLARTVEAAGECERWFAQRMVPSPVAREDDDLAKLANLAIALTVIA